MSQTSHQITKKHHAHVPATPAADPLKDTGYVEKEYEHQEYPKWDDGVLHADAEAHAAHKARKAKAEAAAKAETPAAPAAAASDATDSADATDAPDSE